MYIYRLVCLFTCENSEQSILLLLEDVGAELAEELPGFSVPVDKRGAKFLVTINSKDTISRL
jgi:hypothetical protein